MNLYWVFGNGAPKTSPNECKVERAPRKIWSVKNRANIEKRGNREIRGIRERGFFFACLAYFAVKKVFLGEDLGLST